VIFLKELLTLLVHMYNMNIESDKDTTTVSTICPNLSRYLVSEINLS
jgi:hypothetical protein